MIEEPLELLRCEYCGTDQDVEEYPIAALRPNGELDDELSICLCPNCLSLGGYVCEKHGVHILLYIEPDIEPESDVDPSLVTGHQILILSMCMDCVEESVAALPDEEVTNKMKILLNALDKNYIDFLQSATPLAFVGDTGRAMIYNFMLLAAPLEETFDEAIIHCVQELYTNA